MRYLHTDKSGFTLIEMLVSVALFTVVMTVSVGTLLTLVDANRKSQGLKSVINNLNFALDSMTRTLRTGYSYHCGTSGTLTEPQNCETGGTYIVFTDDQNDRIAYRFNSSNGSIERQVNGGSWLRFTAQEVQVSEMRFYVSGAGGGDTDQPKVTIALRGSAGAQDVVESDFDVQTTVSQRLIDR